MNNLKQEMKNKRISQIELAQLTGVCNDYISRISRGKQNPSFKLAKKIADILQTTVDELFFVKS